MPGHIWPGHMCFSFHPVLWASRQTSRWYQRTLPGKTPSYVTMSRSLIALLITPTWTVLVSTTTRDQSSTVMDLHCQMVIWKLLLAIKPTPCNIQGSLKCDCVEHVSTISFCCILLFHFVIYNGLLINYTCSALLFLTIDAGCHSCELHSGQRWRGIYFYIWPCRWFHWLVNQTSLPYQAYRGTDNSNNDLGALWSSSTSMETFLRNNNCLAVRDELFASKYNIDTASWTCVIGLGKVQ